MKRRGFGREQWVSWFSEFRDSGLSVKAFCRRISVSENSFYHWRKKLDQELQSSELPSAESAAFVPVSIASSTEWKIELPCGATLRVPQDEHSLQTVLKCLFDLKAVS